MHIHFVGIGGIGMSGIAHILNQQGHTISGCDCDIYQKSIAHLTTMGCTIFDGNNNSQCQEETYDIVVYSTVTKNSPEIEHAIKKGSQALHRSIMLAELMKNKNSIAITGSHGKTTTTSLISHLFFENGDDPTFLIGGHLSQSGMNARYGKGSILITEADESDRSLLNLYPSLAIITNISSEHLDTYDNVHDIIHTMQQFIDRLPVHGAAIVGIDNFYIKTLLPQKKHLVITFGFDEQADWRAENIVLETHYSTFDLCHGSKKYKQVVMPMAGKYNILNALAACAAAHQNGMSIENIIVHLATFKGVDRRFSFHGMYKGAAVYDDYGHHPVEIENAITVARKKTEQNLTVIFQPHRYTRTQYLWNEFITLLATSSIDHLIITDIYAAGEQPLPGITGEALAIAIKNQNPAQKITYVPIDKQYTSLKQTLEQEISANGLMLFQGAGMLHKLAESLVISQ